MKPTLAFTRPAGEHKQEVTSITLVNNTAKTELVTVPAGKQWILLAVKMSNIDDVNRVLSLNVWKESAKTNFLRTLQKASVAQNASMLWPTGESTTDETNIFCLVLLAAGNTLECVYAAGGASAGGVDADGLVVEYLELEA